MPGGDRTGPRGEGEMTGRQRGFCAGYNEPGYTDTSQGYGRRRNFAGRGGRRDMQSGYGRGLANRYGNRSQNTQGQSNTIWGEIKQMIASLTNRVERLERNNKQQ